MLRMSFCASASHTCNAAGAAVREGGGLNETGAGIHEGGGTCRTCMTLHMLRRWCVTHDGSRSICGGGEGGGGEGGWVSVAREGREELRGHDIRQVSAQHALETSDEERGVALLVQEVERRRGDD